MIGILEVVGKHGGQFEIAKKKNQQVVLHVKVDQSMILGIPFKTKCKQNSKIKLTDSHLTMTAEK